MSIEALIDVLDELGVGAVALGVSVVGAANQVQEGVEAGRDELGDRDGLYRLDRAGSEGRADTRRSLGGGDRDIAANDRRQGLGDGANSGRDGNSDDGSSDRGSTGRAARNGRLALSDGLGLRGEDGRGGLVAGGNGLSSHDSAGRGSLGRLGAGSGLLGRGSSRNVAGAGAGLIRRSGAAGLIRRRGASGFLGRRGNGRNVTSAGAALLRSGSGLSWRNDHRRLGSRSSDRRGSGGSASLGRKSAGGSVAVEGDGGNLDAARRLRLVLLRRNNDGDILGTTALLVDDLGTGLLAGGALLADRAIRHVVVELEVDIELGLHDDVAQRKLVNVGTAAKGGRVLLIRAADTADDLPAGADSEAATLLDLVLALPATEVEVVVIEKLANVEISEVEALELVRQTLVIRVGRAAEGRGKDGEL